MEVIKESPVTAAQPLPTPGTLKVADLLKSIQRRSVDNETGTAYTHIFEDVILRLDTGEKKYGSALMTFNGRSADLDLYQEILDGIAYITQKVFETPDIQVALELMEDTELLYEIAVRTRGRLKEAGIL